jgi:hypothetical protein
VRGDHVAAVAKGRAGPECAIVLGDRAAASSSSPAPLSGAYAVTERRTVVVDGQSIETDRAAAELIQSLSGQLAALRHVIARQGGQGDTPAADAQPRPDWTRTPGRAPTGWQKNLEDLHRATRNTRAA